MSWEVLAALPWLGLAAWYGFELIVGARHIR